MGRLVSDASVALRRNGPQPSANRTTESSGVFMLVSYPASTDAAAVAHASASCSAKRAAPAEVADSAPLVTLAPANKSERNNILLREPTHDISISVSTEKLPKDLQCTLSAAASPFDHKHRRQLVRCVVEQMLVVCTRPRRELIRSVADEIVRAYPVALEDRSMNGSLIARGYDSFFQQLEARVENIDRSKRGIQSSTPVSAQRS
ncbi:hypothetical protein HPB51_023182 [Rhipicephalus microplus]|uniref:Uncharacterized protein n=1 Tax=Rhipicephalus microplus TaxID=6941 RepID=A0A9J6DD48_RHIMP|nr:hypothetical protein HPB51_023182 [Rhipicephalus microplus]